MLTDSIHPGVSRRTEHPSYFCASDTLIGLPAGLPGKVFNMVMLYKGEVGKVIQIQVSSKTSMTEVVVQEIRNANFSRVSIILGYQEIIALFSEGDMVLLYSALKALGLHTKTYICIDFNNVKEDDTKKVLILLLRLKELGFMFYGNSDRGSDIIRSFEGHVPLKEDAKKILDYLKRKEDLLNALNKI